MCVGISSISAHVDLGQILFLLWTFFLLPPKIERKIRKNIKLLVAVFPSKFSNREKRALVF